MEKKLKVQEIYEAYSVLRQAKTTKLDDGDKLKVFRISNAMRPVAQDYDDTLQSAQETMKKNIEGFDEKQKKVYLFEVVVRQKSYDASQLPCGVEEYRVIADEIRHYNTLVEAACKESYLKEVSLEIVPLEEQVFEKLMSTNDWTMEQACLVANVVL